MRPLWALFLYIAFVFIGGALLAPVLWHLAQVGGPAFPRLAHAPFHRFMDRSFLILALAGLWPLLRALGATSVTEVGLGLTGKPIGNLLMGFTVGFGSLTVLAVLVILGGGRAWNHDLTTHKLIVTLISGVATALLVGTLEEILFRGGAFGGLKRVLNWPWALLISSAIYALVHFLQRTELAGPVRWDSGLLLLPAKLSGFVDFHQLVPGFFNLTLVGLLLGLAYHRTGTLYFSIGLHAGWIFWLKSYGAFTSDLNSSHAWLWGSGRMIDGWLATVVLSVTLFAFRWICPPNPPRPFHIKS